MKKIVEIIKKKLSYELSKDIKDKDLAPYLNTNPSKLALMKSRNSIPYQKIIELCELRKWDLNEIFIGSKSYNDCNDTYGVKFWDNINDACDDENNRSKHIKIDKSIIRYLKPFGNPQNVEALQYFSDDMEPTILKETMVFIDCNIDRLINPGIFVICTSSGISIRRLMKNHQNSGITLIPDNKLYPDEQLQEDEFSIIGKVTGAIEWR